MIAEPDSTTGQSTVEAPTAGSATVSDNGVLSAHELYQLTLYKWRYSLEAFGFEPAEVRDLMFVKWLCASRRVLP